MHFTLGQAAKETGKNKSTISKAIKNGTLSAAPQPDGSYRIEATELFRVYRRRVDAPMVSTPLATSLSSGYADMISENRELKTRVEVLEKYIGTLETDKQFLQGQLDKTTMLLTQAQERQSQAQTMVQSTPKSWWNRIISH